MRMNFELMFVVALLGVIIVTAYVIGSGSLFRTMAKSAETKEPASTPVQRMLATVEDRTR